MPPLGTILFWLDLIMRAACKRAQKRNLSSVPSTQRTRNLVCTKEKRRIGAWRTFRLARDTISVWPDFGYLQSKRVQAIKHRAKRMPARDITKSHLKVVDLANKYMNSIIGSDVRA
jgi:hypothetical protein